MVNVVHILGCGCKARIERIGIECRYVLVQACSRHARRRAPLEGGR